MSLTSQHVLVLGGSAGIGREVARRSHAAGAAVTIVGRTPQRLAAAVHDIGSEVATRVADLTDPLAVTALVAGLTPVDHL